MAKDGLIPKVVQGLPALPVCSLVELSVPFWVCAEQRGFRVLGPSRAAWPLVARTSLALVIPCEQVGNAYVVELVQRQQQSGFGIDPQFEVNSSMMVAACGSSVSSSMQLCVSSGA